MSLHKIKRGLSGNSRDGAVISLKVDGEELAGVTLQAGKYLTIEGIEYVVVTQGKTVSLDVDTWHKEFTVPDGHVMLVRWTYEDEVEPI